MDISLFGDEPWIVLKLSVASCFITLMFTFFRGFDKGCPFVCNWGNPLANMSEVVGNL
jgi:hypothetical protein